MVIRKVILNFNFLYQDDMDGIADDNVSVLTFINNFFDGLGVQSVNVDIDKVDSILRSMRLDFPHKDGLENASPFKKAANFICYFVAEKPVITTIPSEILGQEFLEIKKEPTNAIVALEVAIEALHGAEIYREDGQCTLSKKIKLSNHSYIDIADALCNITPNTHFRLVSVLLEQMAYKSNPDCQYQ